MTLTEYLESFQFMTSDKPNLNAMNWFMEKLNFPNKKLKFIHVAGTNGKGSICEMLSSILISSKYNVGKFISPYLITANESICINNSYFSKKDESTYIPIMEKLIQEYINEKKEKPSRFEVQTSIALLYFLEKKCDIVIFEVGLGGKYDCTNIIISPLVSCFGNISFDHTNILGNTLEEITIQKAGIIKENSNTVIFDNPNILPIIENVCTEKNNQLSVCLEKNIENYKFKKEKTSNKSYQIFDYKDYKEIAINLKGKKQVQNTCVVLETINILKSQGFKISEHNIKNSLKNIIHPGRFEPIIDSPLTIFDGAHNENALENFIESVKTIYPNKKYTFIISQITTKDYKKFITKLLSSFTNSHFIFTSGTDKKRFFEKNILYDFAKTLHLNANYISQLDFDIAIQNIDNKNIDAVKEINTNIDNNVNFIIGSFYTYKKTCEILKHTQS